MFDDERKITGTKTATPVQDIDTLFVDVGPRFFKDMTCFFLHFGAVVKWKLTESEASHVVEVERKH